MAYVIEFRIILFIKYSTKRVFFWKDLHGSWENFVQVNAPLYARKDETGEQAKLNVDWGLTNYIKNGAPLEKINLGLATYGRTFKLIDYTKTDIGSPAKGAGAAGPVKWIILFQIVFINLNLSKLSTS